VRGDDVTFSNEALQLVWVDNLHNVPVFSSAGKKLGVLEGVTINKQRGTVIYAILRCTSLMGLRKTRRVLRQDELIVNAERGGFALVSGVTHEQEPALIASMRAPCRHDPARSV
jgi:sporulation protein YlmC with PRC-barrel domain